MAQEPSTQSHQAVSKATAVYRQICEKIESGEFTNGTKLPPVRKLAKQFGISCPTVLAAMKQLEKKGMLVRALGSGIYVRGDPSGKPAPETEIEPTKLRAKAIADHLVSDIAHGIYRVGDYLPLQKVLQFEYKTSSTTIRRALQMLQDQEVVHRQGNAFIVGDQAVRRLGVPRKGVYVLGDMPRVSYALQSRMRRDFFYAFEKELERHGRTVAGYADLRRQPLSVVRDLSKQDASGFMYLYNSRSVSGSLDKQSELFAKQIDALVRTGLRVVLFDCNEAKGRYPGISLKAGHNFYPLGVDQTDAGIDTGIYVGSLGHKRVAYLSLFNQEWVFQRIRGFKTGMQRVLGKQFKVVPFHALVERTNARKRVSFFKPNSEAKAKLQKLIAEVFDGHQASSMDASGSAFRAMFYDMVLPDVCREHMTPIFSDVLSQGGFSAWVCADHLIGIIAKEFLRRRGVKIPEELSLVAIDDDQNSMLHALTCYDFQPHRLGYLAAHCILGDIPIRKNRAGIVECPGRVIERGSARVV